MNQTAHALHCLAFGYILTDRQEFAEHAKRVVLKFTGAKESLADCVKHPEYMFESICHETLANNLTFVYDLCHGVFSQKEQLFIGNYLRQVADHYCTTFLHNPKIHKYGLGNNTFWRCYEKYIVTMGAVWDPQKEADRLPDILGFLRRSIHRGIDEGGAIYEGPGYGWRDAEWISYLAEVLRRMGAINLWQDEPRFANVFKHWVYLVLPGVYGQNNYCDAGRRTSDRPLIGMLLAARRLNEPVYQWTWEKLGGRGTVPENGTAPDWFYWGLGQSLLWEDNDIESVSPGDAGWPTARTSGQAGVMVMRSAWGDDDTYCSLLASSRTTANNIHQQVDAGHFSLFALGEAFSVDSGYGDILGKYHSVIMPNGIEPSTAPHDFDNMFFGGSPETFAQTENAAYARVDTGEQWQAHWAYRHMMLVNAGEKTPYVLLFDNVNYGSSHMRYLWQINSEPGNRIVVSNENDSATIYGKSNKLQVAWNYPEPGSYVKDHWLKLYTDEIDSLCWRSKNEYTGMGPRPQLKADLWGYNGQLITVLIPRKEDSQSIKVERIYGVDQFGFKLQFQHFTDTVLVSPINRCINVAGLNGEATLAVVRRDQKRKPLWWAAADAYHLDIDDTQVIDHQPNQIDLIEGHLE